MHRSTLSRACFPTRHEHPPPWRRGQGIVRANAPTPPSQKTSLGFRYLASSLIRSYRVSKGSASIARALLTHSFDEVQFLGARCASHENNRGGPSDMGSIRIGGWTRLWIAVSTVFLILGIWGGYSDVRYVQKKAVDQYESEVSAAQAFRDCRAKGPHTPINAVDRWLGGDCVEATGDPDENFAAAEARAAQKRDSAIAAANSAAVSYALNLFLWPAVSLGAFFAAVAWIRAGFRRRA